MASPLSGGSPGTTSPASPLSPASMAGQFPLEQAPKRRPGGRLLQTLQRISSSPSLIRRSRSHSTGYHRDDKASLSCVSLSPAAYTSCLEEPSTSQIYGGLQQPVASPGEDSSQGTPLEGARIRVGALPNASQTTVPLPVDVQPLSRGVQRETASELLDPGNETANANGIAVPAPKQKIDFWKDIPDEIKLRVLRHLTPKEIIRYSAVSKEWHKMCYDGQLWSTIDTSDFYHEIPSDALVKILTSGGPFIKDLNLRGCVQLRDKWASDGERISNACRNVVNFSLEGCRVDKTSIHCFLLRNPRLEYINVSGLSTVTNSAMKIIAQSCPFLDTLNVSWCSSVDTKGLRKIVELCPQLKDLRAGEIRGFNDEIFMAELFKRNTLERLVIHRTDVTDQSLGVLIHGFEPQLDLLTDRPIVPPRNFRHLDLHQCTLTDDGVQMLAHNVPFLQGLQLSQCSHLTDDSIIQVIQTTPQLTHLELEDVEHLTNATLLELAKSPCAEKLEHLNVSYCDNLGDPGMLQVLKNCSRLRSVDMDNTRISDLSLMEASFRIRKRGYGATMPRIGLRLVVFDCVNVTWAGIMEVLSSNAYLPRVHKTTTAVVTVKETADSTSASVTSTSIASSSSQLTQMFPSEIIQLKCFYGWQMTVDEHTKRVLRGDLIAATRLDRKWAEYMMATEEAGVGGAGARRRRRRAREAERLYNADEENGEVLGALVSPTGRRRRARSGGCIMM